MTEEQDDAEELAADSYPAHWRTTASQPSTDATLVDDQDQQDMYPAHWRR